MNDKDLQIQALNQMLQQKDQIIFQLNVALIKANIPQPLPELQKDQENA